jgi:predicted  nucleic acid-binding Zn-ribbon protein
MLLALERTRADEFEAAAKQAQTSEGVLRNQLTTLRDELSEERTKNATLRDELDDVREQLATLRDELEDERRKHAETELQCRKEENRADKMEARYNSLSDDLKRAEAYSTELEEEIERVRGKTEDVRFDLELKIDRLHRESEEHRQSKERVVTEHEGLNRRFEELRARFDESDRALKQRDSELTTQRQSFTASERAHREIHATADSVVRSLIEERNRRITAERHVEQLRQELRRLIMTPPSLLGEAQRLTLLDLHYNLLSTELQEVKHHRDFAVEEQQRLAARLLQLMSPGRYLEHAAAAGYDITTDPLIKRMQESVLIEGQLAQWQRATGKRQRARAFDMEQTVVEQAYAAAIKERWKHVDHPHQSFRRTPYWLATGILLDAESERHLLKVTEDRIATNATEDRLGNAVGIAPRARTESGVSAYQFRVGSTRMTRRESGTEPEAESEAMRNSLLSARSAKDQYRHSQS